MAMAMAPVDGCDSTSDPPSSPFSLTRALGVRAASEPHQSWRGKTKTNTQAQKKGVGGPDNQIGWGLPGRAPPPRAPFPPGTSSCKARQSAAEAA